MTTPALPRYTGMIITFLWVGALGIVAYWVSFFTGGEVHASADPCYLAFEQNFPLPDGFIAFCAVLTALQLQRRRPIAMLWGLLTAGGFFFLGWIDIAYNLWNDMYFHINAAMLAEIVINIFCLGFALALCLYFWSNRQMIMIDHPEGA